MELILPLLLLAAMWFLLIMPQQRRMKAQKLMQANLKVGDDIITTAGIYGTITELEDESILVEVSEGIEVRMAKGAVMKVIAASPTPSEPEAADGGPGES